MAAVLQLVVVDDRDKRVQFWSTDVAGVVVDTVDAQNLLHILGFVCKDSNFSDHNEQIS